MSVCAACEDPLLVEIDDEDSDKDVQMGGSSSSAAAATNPKTVPDDLRLSCGCHFHWGCLLEAYEIAQCPSCNQDLTSANPSSKQQQILCTLHNEGGVQEDLDILPLLSEETYLKAYPEERKARAFLEFCRENDVSAIVGMMDDDDSDSEDEGEDESGAMQTDSSSAVEKRQIDLLRYQDTIGDLQSGLHTAVQAQSVQAVWLLLWMASRLPTEQFPVDVMAEAEKMGLARDEGRVGEAWIDIRGLRDADGKTAADLAREMGGAWSGWEDKLKETNMF